MAGQKIIYGVGYSQSATELCAYVAGELGAELEDRQTPVCSNQTGRVLGLYR